MNVRFPGNSEIKPASADEVAKVIAMTQQQLKSYPQQEKGSPSHQGGVSADT